MLSTSIQVARVFGAFMIFSCSVIVLAGDGQIDQSLDVQSATHQAAKESQRKIDALFNETKTVLLARYQSLMQQADFQAVYRKELHKQLDQQYLAEQRLQKQIEGVSYTRQQLIPLIRKMTVSLEQFISMDLPFLLDERHQRIDKLHKKLDSPSLGMPQKLQVVLDAYLIENEYGRTVEAYQEKLMIGESERLVDILRVGRVALYYQTPDGKEVGRWDNVSRSWRPLASSYRNTLRLGFRVARQQAAPQLLTLPLESKKEVL